MFKSHLIWLHSGATAMNLSIKNAPDDLVRRLKLRAARNHRSLQGELMAIVETAARETPRMTPREVFDEVRKLGLRMPDESTSIVRADRDRG